MEAVLERETTQPSAKQRKPPPAAVQSTPKETGAIHLAVPAETLEELTQGLKIFARIAGERAANELLSSATKKAVDAYVGTISTTLKKDEDVQLRLLELQDKKGRH